MNTSLKNRLFLSPFRVAFKPFDSFEAVKSEHKGALWQIPVQVAAFFLIRVLSLVLSGFLFNSVKIENVNLLLEFLAVLGIFTAFVISNWAFCALTDGNGSLPEIALVSAYALTPYILSSAVNIILSNVLVQREQAFMGIIMTFGLLWSILIGMIGMKTVHEFTAAKTILSLLVTVIFIALIAFLGVIIFSITQQLILFCQSIYNEIVYRM